MESIFQNLLLKDTMTKYVKYERFFCGPLAYSSENDTSDHRIIMLVMSELCISSILA